MLAETPLLPLAPLGHRWPRTIITLTTKYSAISLLGFIYVITVDGFNALVPFVAVEIQVVWDPTFVNANEIGNIVFLVVRFDNVLALSSVVLVIFKPGSGIVVLVRIFVRIVLQVGFGWFVIPVTGSYK
jgi:hypothetical protein